jgi:hypothetical protein
MARNGKVRAIWCSLRRLGTLAQRPGRILADAGTSGAEEVPISPVAPSLEAR